ncbi:CRP-like cAMP-binding protein [Tenacibaculum skagerrakense]|uniref:CRP-like cAMP-binding protein n=1 Tax=Tenacibaculum skagerrakense TaxID=186571 RepID=A0A4V2SMU7_9FLAO|nr:Crp/Fnr family transcriptional regulator [Tenacibaculum skagerrakense]TCP28576.1 CRP-like cAMP-binding protein [Tenacibaculum skagerrakense]
MKTKPSISIPFDEIFHDINLSNEEKDFIQQRIEPIAVTKDEILFRQGDYIDYQYYVYDGCLRTYHIDEQGKEHTLQFAIKHWWISDYIAYFGDKKAVLFVECIKDAELFKISKENFEAIYKFSPKIEELFRQKLEKALVRNEKRILANLTNSAKERYVAFLKKYPVIEKNIKNYHIASYLGITTESLSRIRKEIASDN